MPILGAHQSIAGGYYRAVERARACGCDCVQLFTKNNTQWKARPIVAEEVIRFHQALADSEIAHPLVHDSYLINLASPDKELWKKSVDNFVAELARAQCLGIPYVVTHPGCYVSGTLRGGLRRVIRALNQVHRSTSREGARCLLETTAGQGTSLGWQFEHLAMILDGVREPERLGVCVDTCHLFAAGYRMDDRQQYDATLDALDRTVGLARVRAFHLNDSVKELGSRVDRHAHIGRGHMGLKPFRLLLNDPRFQEVPMYLETPKGQENGVDFDAVNLATLRALVRQSGGKQSNRTRSPNR